MIARGYDPEFASNCFNQIKGFGDYGFPESHAAAFAQLVYVSAWIKWAYPEVFAAALLNSQPMGFYAPAQIVRDAPSHRGRGPPPRRQRQRLGLHAGDAVAPRRRAPAVEGRGRHPRRALGWACGRSTGSEGLGAAIMAAGGRRAVRARWTI